MKTILIIEDNESIRENLEEICELEGYQTISALNGKVGIEKALQDNPHLILCDICMPKKNGYEVFETLKDHLHNNKIPFIFLTASTQEKEIAKGKDIGVDAYITKPFQTDDLLNTIGLLLNERFIL